MPNYRALSDAEVAKEADRYADVVPRELVAELIYRLRRKVGLTFEPTNSTGERLGSIVGRTFTQTDLDTIENRMTITGRVPSVRK